MSRINIRPSISRQKPKINIASVPQPAKPIIQPRINPDSGVTPTNATTQGKKYRVMTQLEHVYKVPDMYAGSDQRNPREGWIYDPKSDSISKGSISLPRVVEQVYRELVNNAADNVGHTRRLGKDAGSIKISMDDHRVTVYNEGETIPVVPSEDIPHLYVPEVIFGILLSSSHYDEEKREDIGRNGLGAKLTNIFSLSFALSIGDSVRHLEYKQEWKNNMKEVEPPSITPYHANSNYVSITYKLDFARFKYNPDEGYPEEAAHLFLRQAADLSFTTRVPVHFSLNNRYTKREFSFELRDIRKYAALYFPPEAIASAIYHVQYPDTVPTIKKKGVLVPKDGYSNPSLEVLLLDTPSAAEVVSFVNTGASDGGGVHVDAVIRAACTGVIKMVNDSIKKKGKSKEKDNSKKSLKVNIKDVRPHLSMLLNCYLTDPIFRDQGKSTLESPTPVVKMEEEVIKPMLYWNLAAQLHASLEGKQLNLLKKQDGKKARYIGETKEDAANEAGLANASKCSLFLVEGDSAVSYPRWLREMIPDGNDYYGILPLRGKILNVMNANQIRIAENNELQQLKKVLGLTEGMDYTKDENYETLRYGQIIILADADKDGIHIIGLVLAYFYCRFPTLIKRQCIYFMRTPIYRVSYGSKHLRLHTEGDFNQWKKDTPNWEKWHIDYFKGLGSSTKDHVREDSQDIRYVVCLYDDKCDNSMRLAFDKTKTDERKVWIANWSAALFMDPPQRLIMKPISDFVNYELITYGLANLIRSIPRFTDGLKPGQRKVVWSLFLRWGKSPKSEEKSKCKVSIFGAEVSSKTGYHHGEDALFSTITTMCQSFVGSNNLPHFVGAGGAGTRAEGGADASSPRYLYVYPEKWISYIYHPDDFPLLRYVVDDGVEAEPYNMLQVLPMAPINGFLGIGSGHSTYGPPHNPLDIASWFKARIRGEKRAPILPWFRGFRGKVYFSDREEDGASDVEDEKPFGLEEFQTEEDDEDGEPNPPISPEVKGRRTLVTEGLYVDKGKGVVEITELPIGRWELTYKKWLEKLAMAKSIKGFSSYCSEEKGPNFILRGCSTSSLESLNLRKTFSMNNMVLLGPDDHPKRYTTVEEILEDFYTWRLPYYNMRKDYLARKLQTEIEALEIKAKFVSLVREGKIDIRNRNREELRREMASYSLPYELATKTTVNDIMREDVELLLAKVTKKKGKLQVLLNTDPKDIWLKDIEAFETAYSQKLLTSDGKVTKGRKIILKRPTQG